MNKKEKIEEILKEIKVKTHPKVYEPREDSFLLARNLIARKGNFVLDVGTGTGLIAIVAAKLGCKVIATDINRYALKIAYENAKMNGVEEMIEFRKSNLFENIREKFDLIVFNPPYLPFKAKTILEKSINAGKNCELIHNFLLEAPSYLKKNGKIQLVVSSLTKLNLDDYKNIKFKKVATEKLFFEKLFVFVGTKA